jgi:RNA polymerase sigma factor (sigma-70 family)
MADSAPLTELLRRIRDGDSDAATEFVQRYEPAIRRSVRLRLGGRMASIFDSVDVSQSVFGSFFLRIAGGQFKLETPDEVLKLLATMARRRVAYQVRRQTTQKRDMGREIPTDQPAEQLAAREPSPSRFAVNRELLAELQRRLTPDELNLVNLRNAGYAWDEIAKELNASAEALRKKHVRALDRIARELNLEEP